MDGTGATTLSGLTASHHDMTAIPGGFATHALEHDGHGRALLAGRASRRDGTMKTDHRQPEHRLQLEHASTRNSIHYYPSDNTYTIGDRNPNLYVKVSRTGAADLAVRRQQSQGCEQVLLRRAGPGRSTTATTCSPTGRSSCSTTARTERPCGFKLNTTTMTATSPLTYTASGATSKVLGDVQRLPNGNILVTSSTSGQIHEITRPAPVVAKFKSTAFGYSEFRESLYGPPPY